VKPYRVQASYRTNTPDVISEHATLAEAMTAAAAAAEETEEVSTVEHLEDGLHGYDWYCIEQVRPPAPALPADPDEKNEDRASWAEHALAAFMDATGSDKEDAVSDLLCDIMHWCDRNDQNFTAELNRAESHYEAETEPIT